MQRVIKFRTWNKNNRTFELCDSGPFDCQQFTGIFDKTGKEIYEGDIVSFIMPGHPHGPQQEEYTNKIVWWDEQCGCWGFRSEKYFYNICADNIDVNSFVITGNVFENDEEDSI